MNHLADTYGLDGDGASDLTAALRQIAEEMAADGLEEAMDGIGYAIPGTIPGRAWMTIPSGWSSVPFLQTALFIPWHGAVG